MKQSFLISTFLFLLPSLLSARGIDFDLVPDRIAEQSRGRSIIACTFYYDLLQGLRPVTEDFTAKTGINVNVQSVPYELYEMWLQSRFLAGRAPEIMILENVDLFWRYGQDDMITNFDSLVEKPNRFDPQKKKWIKLFFSSAVSHLLDPAGHLYMLPFTQYGTGYFYNKKIYEKAGVVTPETWTEMISTFRKIKEMGLPPHASTYKKDYVTIIWVADRILNCFFRPTIPQINLIKKDPDWKFDPFDPHSVEGEKIDLSERIVAFEKGIIDPAVSPQYKEAVKMLYNYAMTWSDDFNALQGAEIYFKFAKGDASSIYNGTWYFYIIDNFQKLINEVAPERFFEYGIFLFPEITPKCSRFATAGGINQNSAVRSFIVVPKQKETWRQKAGILFAQYITSSENAQKLFKESETFDLPALPNVMPRKESMPLLVQKKYASMPITQLQAFDKQSQNETMVLTQLLFMNKIDIDEYLDNLSVIHRNSLLRLYRIYNKQIDHTFIRNQIGKDFK